MKIPKTIAVLFLLLAISLPLLRSSCSGGDKELAEETAELFPDITHRATLLAMRDLGNGATLVDITNPWDTSALLASYLLVGDAGRPDSVPPQIGRAHV